MKPALRKCFLQGGFVPLNQEAQAMDADAHGGVRIQGHGILEPHSSPRLIGEDLDDAAGAGPADGTDDEERRGLCPAG